MPRRDGFPTNRELQVDFTTAARDVFVAAAERELESKIDLIPAYEDKPLDHLRLYVSRRNDVREGSPQAVYRELLEVQPLQWTTVETIEADDPYVGNELFRDTPEAVVEHYKTLCQAIGDTLITNQLRFNSLPPTAIEADWTAELSPHGRPTRHAGSFKERPSKQSLVAATFFVEEAMGYVRSAEFDKPFDVRVAEYYTGLRRDDPVYSLRHGFYFDISPELPLNGHENPAFIRRYYGHMDVRLANAEQRLERLVALQAPQVIIDEAHDRVDLFQKAKSMAGHYLSDQ